MKSRTSYSKLTVFRKDLVRYAPAWGIYTIGLLLFMRTWVSGIRGEGGSAMNLASCIGGMGVANMLYAGLCAMLLFGDLYNTRLCNALHAMPQRRESLFLSHTAAGLCYALIPYLLACLLFLVQLGTYRFVALHWLLAVMLQYVFFFGLAVLCVFLTGHRFAMVAVYAVLNFLSLLIYWFAETIFVPQMYGVELTMDAFLPYSPVTGIFQHGYLSFSSSYDNGIWTYTYLGRDSGWGYLAVLAVIGVALLGLSVLLYRWRHLERAGDFSAFRGLSPVLCVVFTLTCGAVFAVFGELFGAGYLVWMTVGMVIGFFGSLMLLNRTIRVFRPRNFLWLGAFAMAMVLSFLLILVDAFGIVSWTPQADDVKTVSVSPSDYSYYNSGVSVTLDDPEDIEKIITLHASLIEEGEPDDLGVADYDELYLTYTMNSGITVSRSYYICQSWDAYAILQEIYSRPEVILGYTDWDSYVSSVFQIEYFTYSEYNYYSWSVSTEDFQTILEALLADCQEQTVYLNGSYGQLGTVDVCQFEIKSKTETGRYQYRTVVVTAAADHTLQVVKELDLPAKSLLGYDDWETYLADVSEVTIAAWDGETLALEDPMILEDADIPQFLEALRTDINAGADISWGYYEEFDDLVAYIEISGMAVTVRSNAENTLQWLQAHGFSAE